MTPARIRARLLAAPAVVLALLLGIGASTSLTSAAWTDSAAFVAGASSGTWGPVQKCEVVQISDQQVVGQCTITAVRATGQWGVVGSDGFMTQGGLQFQVELTAGYTVPAGRVLRMTVDMSKVVGTASKWNWAAGSIVLFNASAVSWSPPFVTFTTYEHNQQPFGGQFTAP